MSKCDVCVHDGETFVACSICGGISFAYCKECLKVGAEPWECLAIYIAFSGGKYPENINESFREAVKATCERLNKTEEDFIKRVDDILDGGLFNEGDTYSPELLEENK